VQLVLLLLELLLLLLGMGMGRQGWGRCTPARTLVEHELRVGGTMTGGGRLQVGLLALEPPFTAVGAVADAPQLLLDLMDGCEGSHSGHARHAPVEVTRG
jgi:hypothetical protein